jgi:acetoin utilization deacetylase AcuC-like enzyme
MEKYELIPEQLIFEGIINNENLFEPTPLDESVILLTHDADYWQLLKTLTLDTAHQRRIGFKLNADLIKRELCIMHGTLQCAHYAIKNGAALNVAGGTHHAFKNKGEGFCLLNDFAITANYLLKQKLAARILIVDLDVHQGNGTAAIFSNQPNVFTFSMHGKHNYPFFKEKSDLDVELPDGINDKAYLDLLEKNLTRIFKLFKPDFVCYQSGVDILASDKLGKLNISIEGCKTRDEMVFAFCRVQKIPVVVAMGGGYSPKISDIVNAHCNTFKAAMDNIW